MNLFCFTLEGSTDSIYEPAYSQTLKEVLPKYQSSPAMLRQKPEWGGSDPSINTDRLQNTVKVKRNNRRSCLPASLQNDETLEKDIHPACWMSSGDKRDSPHHIKVRNKETCKSLSQSNLLTREDRVKELNSDRTQTHLPPQGGETAADTAESIHTTGRLKKLQNLAQIKKEHQSGAGKGKSISENNDHLANVLINNNPVLTCISLGKRTEKKPSKTAPSPQQQQPQAKHGHEYSEEDGVWSPRLGNYPWSPFECSQPWSSFYHTCHQPQHELWVCGGTLSLPKTSEWDRFESLVQELDSKHTDLSPPQTDRSNTDLQPSRNTLTRFGRFDAFRQHSPLMKPRDNGRSVQKKEQNGDETKVWLRRRDAETSSHLDRKHVKAPAEKTLSAVTNGKTQKGEAEKRGVGGGRSFTKGHKRSSNSTESLYSLNSGQSSSSGVTSGSDYSSNRDSLRLEDDLLSTRQFCGRARVHTDYVPSPYDTESLKLKVGDVIDIIAKPHMGIWTGLLNGKMGNFKFIYVDVLTEEDPDAQEETQTHLVRQKSTVQEVLKRLSLEEYFSSLQLNGYQTVDDLMRLKEHHLTGLNVTDPEHRHRLLAAVDSLQQLCSDSQLENEANDEAETPAENVKADTNNCPRDSGCHMPSDSPDNSTEDTDLHFFSEYTRPAEMIAS